MKRWAPTYFLLGLISLPFFFVRATSQALLQDSDTNFLLAKLGERSQSGESVFKWFSGDWPLGNHFYRPISTLTFEFDRWKYGTEAWGYGLTNVLLIVACLWALFWLVREISGSRAVSLGTSAIFALWCLDRGQILGTAAYLLGALSLGAVFLKGRNWKNALIAALLWVFVGNEASAISNLQFRMIDWLPGRTASTMALFALLCLASYARFERLGAKAAPEPAPSPYELPPSKTFVPRQEAGKLHYLWLGLSLICLGLAMGSYEQAVMLPSILIGLAWLLRSQGLLVRWQWVGSSFAILIAYLAMRHQVIPSTASAYQDQQFRTSISVFYAVMDYLLPGLQAVRWQFVAFTVGWEAILFSGPWLAVIEFSSNVAALAKLALESKAGIFYFGASVLAYLPMAWFKQFDHYHFLPMAFRAGLFVVLIGIAGKATLTAASHPAIRVNLQPNP